MRLFDRIFRVPFFRPEFGVDVAGLPVKELMAKKGEDKVKKKDSKDSPGGNPRWGLAMCAWEGRFPAD